MVRIRRISIGSLRGCIVIREKEIANPYPAPAPGRMEKEEIAAAGGTAGMKMDRLETVSGEAEDIAEIVAEDNSGKVDGSHRNNGQKVLGVADGEKGEKGREEGVVDERMPGQDTAVHSDNLVVGIDPVPGTVSMVGHNADSDSNLVAEGLRDGEEVLHEGWEKGAGNLLEVECTWCSSNW